MIAVAFIIQRTIRELPVRVTEYPAAAGCPQCKLWAGAIVKRNAREHVGQDIQDLFLLWMLLYNALFLS